MTTATLSVTHTESISLNDREQGGTKTYTIASIAQVFKRTVTCPAGSDTTIATFQTATSTSDSALDLENTKYIRVTNLDSSNSVNLSLQVAGAEGGTANMSTTILLGAGETFTMGTPHDGIALDDDAAAIVTSLNDLESLLVDPGSNAVAVEVFVASTQEKVMEWIVTNWMEVVVVVLAVAHAGKLIAGLTDTKKDDIFWEKVHNLAKWMEDAKKPK